MSPTAVLTTIHPDGMPRPAKTSWLSGRNHEIGVVSVDPLCRGLIPHWCQDPSGGSMSHKGPTTSISRCPALVRSTPSRAIKGLGFFHPVSSIR